MATKEKKPCVEVFAPQMRTLLKLIGASANYLIDHDKFVLAFDNSEQAEKTIAALESIGILAVLSLGDSEYWKKQ